MVEEITGYLVGLFSEKLSGEITVFLISMMPILELRGGMIAASLLGVSMKKALLICYIGNIVPIPFILLFIRRIFRFFRKFRFTEKIVNKIEKRTMKKKDKIIKYKRLGLLAFVAIPLPGTGGWTGSLLADLLDIRFRVSLPLIALGILIADVIMAVFSYGLFANII